MDGGTPIPVPAVVVDGSAVLARYGVRFVPLTLKLLLQVVAEERDPGPDTPEARAFRSRMVVPGLSFAEFAGERLVAAAGVIPFYRGRAYAWLKIASSARRREIVAGMRATRSWYDQLQLDPAFRRLEYAAKADAPWCQSQADALGFVLEARKVAFGPDGSDFAEYARIARPPSQGGSA